MTCDNWIERGYRAAHGVGADLTVFGGAWWNADWGIAADPEAVVAEGMIHLWFSGGAVRHLLGVPVEGVYGIGHATSRDGIRWTASRANPVLPGMSQPTVVRGGGGFEMWYGNLEEDGEGMPIPAHSVRGYRYARSNDGDSWTAAAGYAFAWSEGAPGEELGLITGVEVVRVGDEDRMYYNAWGRTGVPAGWDVDFVWAMNLATRRAGSAP